MGVEQLTTLFPVETKDFEFVVENEGRQTKYILDAQSLRLFGLRNDNAEDVHHADANRLIKKGRSPILRYGSRTRRVNLDLKIQIMCVDSRNQLADILTKGNFARNAWNHLLCLLMSASSALRVALKPVALKPVALKPWRRGRRKVITRKRVVAKSKTNEKCGIDKP